MFGLGYLCAIGSFIEETKEMTDEDIKLELMQYTSNGIPAGPVLVKIPDGHHYQGDIYTETRLTILLTQILSALKQLGCEIKLTPPVPAQASTFFIKAAKPNVDYT